MPYPLATNAFHFEVELVVAIGRGGCAIDTDKAADHVFGLAVGLDMTRRDLQLQARQTGRPWDTGKNFDNSAPIGMIHRLNNDSPMDRGRIWLERNGTVVQDANVSQLTWSVSEVISHLSRLYPLAAGDLIMTGTPAGVGSVEPGDHLIGHIEGLTSIEIRIGPVAN